MPWIFDPAHHAALVEAQRERFERLLAEANEDGSLVAAMLDAHRSPDCPCGCQGRA